MYKRKLNLRKRLSAVENKNRKYLLLYYNLYVEDRLSTSNFYLAPSLLLLLLKE